MDVDTGAETSSASPTVRIQLLSDLHLEMPRPYYSAASGYSEDGHIFQYDFPARADVIALLGDIGVTRDDRLFTWLGAQLKRFKLVFFLSGNHEAYHSSLVSKPIDSEDPAAKSLTYSIAGRIPP